MGQMSFYYFNTIIITKLNSDLSASVFTEMDLAPFSQQYCEEVVKASSGHYPLPFLIRD